MEQKKTLLKTSQVTDPTSEFALTLLNSVTVIHLAHLTITGPGSFAAHKALNDFYDNVGDLSDSFIEQYQGLSGKLISYPPTVQFDTVCCVAGSMEYLTKLYEKVRVYQASCDYSELNNTLDEIKSLINATVYKLKFLT